VLLGEKVFFLSEQSSFQEVEAVEALKKKVITAKKV